MQKYARIGETNYVRNIEDQCKYHNGDKSVMLVRSRQNNETGTIHDRLNLSKDTKKRPSQRAGNTYSAVQNNLQDSMRLPMDRRECMAKHSPSVDRISRP